MRIFYAETWKDSICHSLLNMCMNYVTLLGIFDRNFVKFSLFQPVELEGRCRILSLTVSQIRECVLCGNYKHVV
jgi:hypothetical protein